MKNKIGIFLMIIGTVLIGSALFLLLHNQKEDRSAGQASQSVMEKMQEELVEKGKEHSYEMIDGMPVIKIDGQDYIGVLEIPALNLRLPVMAEWSYPKLRVAPCRQQGSVVTNDLVIAGHNYQRHFGRLSELKENDQIFFTNTYGERYSYKVGCKEILKPDQGKDMMYSEWDLTLYTCTYGGKTRITIRANRSYGD